MFVALLFDKIFNIMVINVKDIILASSSPRRKELLEQIRMPFKIVPSNFEENINELEGTPVDKVKQLAYMKANDVAESISEGLVLGADTIVVVDDEILGKSKSSRHAFEMLSKLSGKKHQVITGLAIIDTKTKEVLVDHEITDVIFSQLTESEIQSYLNTGEYEGKAGSYAIQGIGSLFVEKIDGCYFNVVGLPINKLKTMLFSFGVNLL